MKLAFGKLETTSENGPIIGFGVVSEDVNTQITPRTANNQGTMGPEGCLYTQGIVITASPYIM